MRRIVRRRGFSFLKLSLVALILVFVISYISFRKLVFVDKDAMLNGKKLTEVAKTIRDGLIKKHGAKQFVFTSKEDISLAGLIIKRQNPVGTMVLCHGFKCCKELMSGYVDLFPDYNIVMFDFRSHGENKRSLTTIGCHEYRDVITVVNWIKKSEPDLTRVPFIILGVSMGGAAALKAVEKDKTLCDGLIVDSAFSSLKSLLDNTFELRSGLPSFPFLTIMKKMFNYACSCDIDAFKPIKSVKRIKQPLMLIHSCTDAYIPVQESLLMYAQGAKTGAKLWIAPECKHGWLHKEYPEVYKQKLTKFIDSRIKKIT